MQLRGSDHTGAALDGMCLAPDGIKIVSGLGLLDEFYPHSCVRERELEELLQLGRGKLLGETSEDGFVENRGFRVKGQGARRRTCRRTCGGFGELLGVEGLEQESVEGGALTVGGW